MIQYSIVAGTPSEAEKEALNLALMQHERPKEITPPLVTVWGKPQLRTPLSRKS